jgi:hypothetical protein
MTLSNLSRRRSLLRHASALVAGLALVACSPSDLTGPDGGNTFQWYADGCVNAADVARSLYASADNPVSRTLAEKSLDTLELAGAKVVESLPQESPFRTELSDALAKLDSRIPLTDISADEREKFERNKLVVDGAISEVGQMCRSIFAGFESTRSPSLGA